MMLRITPVGMTERSLAFSGEKSVCFLGAVEPLCDQCRRETNAIASIQGAN